MNCLITLFGLCLFDPVGIALEGDMSWAAGGMHDYSLESRRYDGTIGRIALAVDVPATATITLRYGLEHRSYIETARDRGEERAFIGLVWRPFR